MRILFILLILFVACVAGHGVDAGAAMTGVRHYFMKHGASLAPFGDAQLRAAKRTVLPAQREASLSKDKSYRIPYVWMFVEWIWKRYNSENADKKMIILAIIVQWDKGKRVGNLVHTGPRNVCHALQVSDVLFSDATSDPYNRVIRRDSINFAAAMSSYDSGTGELPTTDFVTMWFRGDKSAKATMTSIWKRGVSYLEDLLIDYLCHWAAYQAHHRYENDLFFSRWGTERGQGNLKATSAAVNEMLALVAEEFGLKPALLRSHSLRIATANNIFAVSHLVNHFVPSVGQQNLMIGWSKDSSAAPGYRVGCFLNHSNLRLASLGQGLELQDALLIVPRGSSALDELCRERFKPPHEKTRRPRVRESRALYLDERE